MRFVLLSILCLAMFALVSEQQTADAGGVAVGVHGGVGIGARRAVVLPRRAVFVPRRAFIAAPVAVAAFVPHRAAVYAPPAVALAFAPRRVYAPTVALGFGGYNGCAPQAALGFSGAYGGAMLAAAPPCSVPQQVFPQFAQREGALLSEEQTVSGPDGCVTKTFRQFSR